MNFTQNELEYWMNQSLELARNAGSQDDVPVGAILVSSGKVLGKGLNTRNKNQNTLGHAELVALEKYNRLSGQWRLPQNTSIYVTTEPCVMCTGALMWARVENIYYGCEDPKNCGLRSLASQIEDGRFDHRPSVIEGNVLGEECGARLSSFFSEKRKKRAHLKACPQLVH